MPERNHYDKRRDNECYCYHDEINDKINDLGLEILKIVKANPGIKVPDMVERIRSTIPDVNLNRVRNEIRRSLKDYIVYEGSRKTGGYYILQRQDHKDLQDSA